MSSSVSTLVNPEIVLTGIVSKAPETRDSNFGDGTFTSFEMYKDYKGRGDAPAYRKWYTVTVNGDLVPPFVHEGTEVTVRGRLRGTPGTKKRASVEFPDERMRVTRFKVAADDIQLGQSNGRRPVSRLSAQGRVTRAAEPTRSGNGWSVSVVVEFYQGRGDDVVVTEAQLKPGFPKELRNGGVLKVYRVGDGTELNERTLPDGTVKRKLQYSVFFTLTLADESVATALRPGDLVNFAGAESMSEYCGGDDGTWRESIRLFDVVVTPADQEGFATAAPVAAPATPSTPSPQNPFGVRAPASGDSPFAEAYQAPF